MKIVRGDESLKTFASLMGLKSSSSRKPILWILLKRSSMPQKAYERVVLCSLWMLMMNLPVRTLSIRVRESINWRLYQVEWLTRSTTTVSVSYSMSWYLLRSTAMWWGTTSRRPLRVARSTSRKRLIVSCLWIPTTSYIWMSLTHWLIAWNWSELESKNTMGTPRSLTVMQSTKTFWLHYNYL